MSVSDVQQAIEAAEPVIPEQEVSNNQDVPIPLRPSGEMKYPVEALGPLLGPVAAASFEAIQAHEAICGSSYLAAASLAVQAHGNVELDGRICPSSLNILSIAQSSDRKSTADKAALRPHREHEEAAMNAFQDERKNHYYESEAWEAERKRISQIKEDKERSEALQALGPEPLPPLIPMMMTDEPTVEGMIKLCEIGRGSFGLFSDEAAKMFGGHSMKAENRMKCVATLSHFFDGAPIKDVRKGQEVKLHTGKRLASHLMVQPVIIQQILEDPIMVQQGILARYLPLWPESPAGTRFYTGINLSDSPAYQAYLGRMREMLNVPFSVVDDRHGRNILIPKSLEPAEDAKRLWIEFYNTTEAAQAEGGELYSIRPFAGKAGEQVLRVAATLALVENLETILISADHVEAAIQIMQFHLYEALRMYDPHWANPKLADAEKLLNWLHKRSTGNTLITLSEIYQLGPNRLREKQKALKAIEVLEAHHWLIRQPATAINGKKSKDVWEVR